MSLGATNPKFYKRVNVFLSHQNGMLGYRRHLNTACFDKSILVSIARCVINDDRMQHTTALCTVVTTTGALLKLSWGKTLQGKEHTFCEI